MQAIKALIYQIYLNETLEENSIQVNAESLKKEIRHRQRTRGFYFEESACRNLLGLFSGSSMEPLQPDKYFPSKSK